MSSIPVCADGLLDVRGLRVEFATRRGPLCAIDDVSFTIRRGEILGMVGESGAGKSMIGAAVTGLLPPGARVTAGEIRLDGRDIARLPEAEMRRLRGRRIATIFQDPLTSLNPLYTIGHQMAETISVNLGVGRAEAEQSALDWLRRVGLPDPARRLASYPHEFSGGMRQRVVIALALCTRPELIIADEPTTALDVSVQAQIIALLRQLAREENAALLLITHDMGVIAEVTDRVAVLYVGRVVETGPTADILERPEHPYTRGLMRSIPRLGQKPERLPQLEGAMPRLSRSAWEACAFRRRCPHAFDRCAHEAPTLARKGPTEAACFHDFAPGEVSLPAEPLSARPRAVVPPPSPPVELSVVDLTCHFRLPSSFLDRVVGRKSPPVVSAVDGVSFHIRRSQTFALVGESGCGKSTAARLIAGLVAPTRGQVTLDGVPLVPYTRSPQQSAALRNVQMVFQDPYSSLDPRWSVGRIIAEPCLNQPSEPRAGTSHRVVGLLEQVGLSADDARRHPHAFSGGQRQRISIARALAGDPTLLICDEPTSALDVSVQAQILNLMKDLQHQHKLTMLFISHDLAVVNFIADVVGVMYLGRLCEIGTPQLLFERPLHPYTRLLRNAVPNIDRIGEARPPAAGEVPSPLNPPAGCRFHTRCPLANARCRAEVPAMREYEGSWAACHGLDEGRIEIPSAQVIPLPRPLPEPAEIEDERIEAAGGRRWWF